MTPFQIEAFWWWSWYNFYRKWSIKNSFEEGRICFFKNNWIN